MNDRRQPTAVAATPTMHRSLLTSPVALPDHCVWYVLLSALDIMLTWVVLSAGGYEVNHVAAMVIDSFGLAGAVLLKMVTVAFVLGVIQLAARSDAKLARTIAMFAVGVSAFPVFSAAFQLAAYKAHMLFGA